MLPREHYDRRLRWTVYAHASPTSCDDSLRIACTTPFFGRSACYCRCLRDGDDGDGEGLRRVIPEGCTIIGYEHHPDSVQGTLPLH